MPDYQKSFIERAEKEFPMPIRGELETQENFVERAAYVTCKRDGFIKALSESGAGKLEEALEFLIQDIKRKPNDTRYATAIKKAEEALASFANPGNEIYTDAWKKCYYELRKHLEKLVHLHGCEQEGLSSGKPTPEMWFNTVNRAADALSNNPGNEQGGDDKRESKTQSQAAYDEAMKEIEDQELSNPK